MDFLGSLALGFHWLTNAIFQKNILLTNGFIFDSLLIAKTKKENNFVIWVKGHKVMGDYNETFLVVFCPIFFLLRDQL